MGMSAKQWDTVTSEAADILGQDWQTFGKGRKRILLRTPVHWWIQFIYYENSSLGRLIAYQGLLAKPLYSSQTGEGGVASHRIRPQGGPGWFSMPGYTSFPSSMHTDPNAVADFARAVEDGCFAPARDWNHTLAQYEAWYQRTVDPDWDVRGFAPDVPQTLAIARLMCGTRSREELVGDFRWLLDDTKLFHPLWADRRPVEVGEHEVRSFFEALLLAIDDANRGALDDLIVQMRSQTLDRLGIPPELVGTVEFPEPKVKW